MAVPSTGPLELRGDINLEVNGNTTDINVGLHQLSLDAGFSVPDAMSDFYGYSAVEAPSVVSKPVTSVSVSAQTLNGCVTNTGGENVSRGFYHGTSTNRTSNTKYTIGGTQGTGNFACGRSGLSQGTTYYNWAFACNSAGEAVGNRCQANTGFPPYTPTLKNACFTGIQYFAPTSNFAVYDNSNFAPPYACSFGGCMGYINPYTGGGVQLLGYSSAGTFQYNSPGGPAGQGVAAGIRNYGGMYGNSSYCTPQCGGTYTETSTYLYTDDKHCGCFRCAGACNFGLCGASMSGGGADNNDPYYPSFSTNSSRALAQGASAAWSTQPNGAILCNGISMQWRYDHN